MSRYTYINQWRAKQAQIRLKRHELGRLEAEEIISGCFHVIRDVVPILKERAAMECICECPSPCRCGKDGAIELLKKLYSQD